MLDQSHTLDDLLSELYEKKANLIVFIRYADLSPEVKDSLKKSRISLTESIDHLEYALNLDDWKEQGNE